MENVAENAPSNGLGGKINGSVFWNNTIAKDALDYGYITQKDGNQDPAVVGIKVFGSYLSDQAIAKIHNEGMLAIGANNIRGIGWTQQNEEDLQNWIKEQFAIDGKDFWIAETVETVTDANGAFSLQFKGTYGNRWDNAGIYSPSRNDGALPGTLAPSADAGPGC